MASEEHLFVVEDDAEAVLVEKAYIRLVEGTYPTGATKNEKKKHQEENEDACCSKWGTFLQKERWQHGKKITDKKLCFIPYTDA